MAAASRRTQALVLWAAILGSAMVFIDGTVVGVALPALQRALGATLVEAQWVVVAYTLFLSSLMLTGGALGDALGRRRLFATGTALFAGASLWCGLAPSIGQLIAARAAQGIAGALLTPGSLALIASVFPEQERGRAIGTWSGWSGVTTAAGPLLGGWLIDRLSWRWAFFVNLPLAVLVLVLVYAGVPESRAERQRPDVAGALLVTAGLGGVVFGAIQSSVLSFRHPAVIAGLAGGGAALIAFAAVEKMRADPMLPLALFRSRAFSVANLITLFLYGALAVGMFFLPFNLMQVQGYSALAAGAALLPFVAIVFVLSRPAGKLVDRVGPRLPLVVGPAIAAVGLALFARPGVGGAYVSTFLPPVAVLGVGMGFAIAPLTTTVMNAVDSRHAGLASGVNNAVSRLAGLLAIAVLSLVMIAVFDRELARRLDQLDLPRAARVAIDAQRIRLAAIEIPAWLAPAARARTAAAINDAFVAGFRSVALVAAGLAAASAALGLAVPSRSAPRL
jgi:EmrB/QacA subfamily drug resistance transporter